MLLYWYKNNKVNVHGGDFYWNVHYHSTNLALPDASYPNDRIFTSSTLHSIFEWIFVMAVDVPFHGSVASVAIRRVIKHDRSKCC